MSAPVNKYGSGTQMVATQPKSAKNRRATQPTNAKTAERSSLEKLLFGALASGSAAGAGSSSAEDVQRVKQAVHLQPRVGPYVGVKTVFDKKDGVIFLSMLDNWKLREARLIELWGVDIFISLEKYPDLKKHAPEFAKCFFQAYIFLIEQRTDSILKQKPGTNRAFKSGIEISQNLAKLVYSIQIVANKAASNNKKKFFDELMKKIDMGMKGLSMDILSMDSYIKEPSIREFNAQRVKKNLAYSIDKLRLLESGYTQFCTEKHSSITHNQLTNYIKFGKQLETFQQSLSFSDFILLNDALTDQATLLKGIEFYKDLSKRIETQILSPFASVSIEPYVKEGSLMPCSDIQECYSAARQGMAQHEVLFFGAYFDLGRNIYTNIYLNLFPNSVYYVHIYNRLKISLEYFSDPDLFLKPLPKMSMKELVPVESEMSHLPCSQTSNLYKDSFSAVTGPVLRSMDKGLEVNGHVMALDMKDFKVYLSVFNIFIQGSNQTVKNLKTDRDILIKLLKPHLKAIPLTTIKQKKKEIVEALQNFHFQQNLEFTLSVLMFKDMEFLLTITSHFVEDEIELIPDELVDYLYPGFEELLDEVIIELETPATAQAPALTGTETVTAAAISTATVPTQSQGATTQPAAAQVIGASAAATPTVPKSAGATVVATTKASPIKTADVPGDAKLNATATGKQVSTKPLADDSKDHKAQALAVVKPQKEPDLEIRKFRSHEKKRKILAEIRQFKKQLVKRERPGKGSHGMMYLGDKSVVNLPKGPHVAPYNIKRVNEAVARAAGAPPQS